MHVLFEYHRGINVLDAASNDGPNRCFEWKLRHTHREKSIIDEVLETKEGISNILRKELIIVHIRQACNLEYLTLRVLV